MATTISRSVTDDIADGPHGGHPGLVTFLVTLASTYAPKVLSLADFGLSWLTTDMAKLARFRFDPAVNGYHLKATDYLNVSDVSTANPGVVTVETTTGLATGDSVTIAATGGTTEAVGTFPITVINGTTFSIPVNVTNTYTSGGTVTPVKKKPDWLGILRAFNGATEASSTVATTARGVLHIPGQ